MLPEVSKTSSFTFVGAVNGVEAINEKRLARGDRGINPLDAACREHDIAYFRSNDLVERHAADRILAKKAQIRITAKDSSLGERAAATAVWIAMKTKKKFGMGLKTKTKKQMRRAIRILSRRYALITTEFKFLEIGINVGTPSYVEIVIGDHQGKELVLSLETWKGLYEQRRNIHDLLRKDSKDTYNFISVGPLTVRIHTINDTKLISLESLNVRMMMIEPTLHRMFDLDQCIDVTFDRLVRITETVDTKFTQFSNIASTITDNKKMSNVICASDVFNKHQLVDCELVALVFSHNI
ncbi:uncharacterized protein [Anoplolepis gracilipes]|uniref:uncharacterized protein n=1 Tax=Anoplolepis gracilipes TaxID=354296 RepID=UPI003BA0F777